MERCNEIGACTDVSIDENTNKNKLAKIRYSKFLSCGEIMEGQSEDGRPPLRSARMLRFNKSCGCGNQHACEHDQFRCSAGKLLRENRRYAQN